MSKFFKKVMAIKDKSITGYLDSYDGRVIRGWAASTQQPSEAMEVSIYIGSEHYKTVLANRYRSDLDEHGISNGVCSFEVELPVEKYNLEGNELNISAFVGEQELIGSPIVLNPPEIGYSVDVSEGGRCAGWIVDFANENIRVPLELTCNGISRIVHAELERADLSVIGINDFHHGFDFLVCEELNLRKVEYSVSPAYGSDKILVEETFVSFPYRIDLLHDLQFFLKKNKYFSDFKLEEVSKSIIPSLISQARVKGDLTHISCAGNGFLDPVTAVIIPVYMGVTETVECIKSVMLSSNRKNLRLVVINDCSPDENMMFVLNELQHQFGFELYENSNNLGFVGTVNRGMKIADRSDVVLLNSDTEVSDGWLDALIYEAYESKYAEFIGTVTPISNNATICSFPDFCKDNDLPVGWTGKQLAKLCASTSINAVDLPTAHGYCMFIKRSVLDEVGLFDEEKWGKGYAEENDFSLRASSFGWRHVATSRTFVVHHGAVSFASDSNDFIEKNLAYLNTLYPDYAYRISDFIKKDPMKVIRDDLTKRMLEKEALDSSNTALIITLAIGGGTKVASDSVAEMLRRDNYSVLELTPVSEFIWKLSSAGRRYGVSFDISESDNDLISYLSGFDLEFVNFHHVIGFSNMVWSIPEKLNVPYFLNIHDYFYACPRINFTKNGEYCEEPKVNVCNECISAELKDKYPLLREGVGSWIEYYSDKLGGAKKVIVPSFDHAKRLGNRIELKNLLVKPHPEEVMEVEVKKQLTSSKVIGFIGAIGPHKGLQVIKDLVCYIADNSLDYEVEIIGYTSHNSYFDDYGFVRISGEYEGSELPSILVERNVGCLCLVSIWPETFSYTFSEALSSGLPVIVSSLGAVAERSESMPGVFKVSKSPSPEELIGCYEEIVAADIVGKRSLGASYDNVLNDYFE